MKVRTCGLGLMVALSLAWGTAGFAQEQGHDKHAHDQAAEKQPAEGQRPLCPVMDEEIDFTSRTVTDEGPVYFCCDMCINKYKKDPAKFAEKVAAQREALRKLPRVQVTCPLSGEPVSADARLEQGGQTVLFCCKECMGKYQKEPARYAGALEAAYCYQTRCPVSGKEISPTASKELPTGQRIYFCCNGCPEKFIADPEKYVGKLAEQGVKVDPKKVKKGAAGENP